VGLAFGVVSVGALAVADTGSAGGDLAMSDNPVLQAAPLPGDVVARGPVLRDNTALWAETGPDLVVRSLDASGRTRSLYVSSAAPGLPAGGYSEFHVPSIAAAVAGSRSSERYSKPTARPT
jgi:hypothetical protein